MGACCTKDPREGHTDVKEANLDHQFISERAARPETDVPMEDTPDDLKFKKTAATIKSHKSEINVSGSAPRKHRRKF